MPVLWPVPPNGPNGTYVFNELQDYGPRPLADSPFHNGLDFSDYPGGSTGIEIRTIASGQVIGKGFDAGLGNILRVRHDGYESRYCHMQAASPLVIGDVVSQGSFVGRIGETGTSARGAHLHLDIFLNGSRIDPQAFIRNNYGNELPTIEEKSQMFYIATANTPNTVYCVYNDGNGRPRMRVAGANEWAFATNAGFKKAIGDDATLMGLAAECGYAYGVPNKAIAPTIDEIKAAVAEVVGA